MKQCIYEWEGEVKVEGMKYWAYAEYSMDTDVYGYEAKDGPVVESIRLFNKDGSDASEAINAKAMDSLTNGAVAGDLFGLTEEE